MSYELRKPITETQRMDFISEYAYKQGLQFVDTDYFLFALEPNEIMGEKEIEIDVPDFETITEEYEDFVYDENGFIVYDESGNPVTETKTREVVVPVMIEIEVEVPDYDEEGNIIGYHTETQEVQQTHKETIIVPYPVIDPDYEEKQRIKERARLDALTLTPSDVERALYYSDLKMDFDDLKALISKEAPTIDLKGLAIEFRANNFYRGAVDKDGNRIIDMVGMLLGYDAKDMDYLFEHKELPTKGTEDEG